MYICKLANKYAHPSCACMTHELCFHICAGLCICPPFVYVPKKRYNHPPRGAGKSAVTSLVIRIHTHVRPPRHVPIFHEPSNVNYF